MQTHIASIIFVAAIAAGIVSVSTAVISLEQPQAKAQGIAPFEINSAISEDRIVITIVKSSAAQELPEGPIVIIPPNTTEGEDNATVILPEPPANETGAPPGNITIIEPDGEVSQLPAGNITTTPGNVTVIDPPACGCPIVGEEEAEPGVPTQLPIMPSEEPPVATQLPAAEPEPPVATQLPAETEQQEETESSDDGGGGNGNGDGNGGG